jgi:CBS domain-containing protein
MVKRVRELMLKEFVKIGEKERIYKAVEDIAKSGKTTIACVVDEEGRLKGIITPRELLKAIEVREFGAIRYPFFDWAEALGLLTSKYAEDIMSAPVSVRSDDEVERAINIMLDKGFYEVPVVDEEGRVVGEITYFSIIESSIEYLREAE